MTRFIARFLFLFLFLGGLVLVNENSSEMDETYRHLKACRAVTRKAHDKRYADKIMSGQGDVSPAKPPNTLSKHFTLRPQKRGGLLGTRTGGRGVGEGGERVKTRVRTPTRKAVDRSQNNKNVKAVSHSPLLSN